MSAKISVEIARKGERSAVGFVENRIDICDATIGKKIHSINGEKTGFSAFAFSPDGKVLAVREMVSPLVHLYDVESRKEIRCLDWPSNDAAINRGKLRTLLYNSIGLIFSPDGKRLAGSIDEKSVGVWNLETGKRLGLIQLSDSRPPKALSFSPDNRILALGTEGDVIVLWEIASNQVRRYLGKRPETAKRDDNSTGVAPPGNAVGGAVEVFSLYVRPATNLTFSPDGKVICQARSDQKIALWETATGRELERLDGKQGEVTSLAFSSNGRQLASGGSDTTTLLWDLNKLLPALEGAKTQLSDKEMEAEWADLAATDASQAYLSMCHLSAASDSTVVFLKIHLKPVQPIGAGYADKLIMELDDRQFEIREKASRELLQLGELVVPASRKALKGKISPEMKKRLEELLGSIDSHGNMSGERIQILRALEVLERVGTPEARQLLQRLADGAKGALQTEEAKESLQRLNKNGPTIQSGKTN
jgi:hypothetical protein